MEGQLEVEKLRLENSHLQLKLRAQEGVVQKLLKEKESAQIAQQEAEETVRYNCRPVKWEGLALELVHAVFRLNPKPNFNYYNVR